MNRSIIPFRGMTAALWLLFSGCAVLTVDVDVYKGALVNEEHVQLHQLVALATAAKPMLIQLRDNLEWPDTDGKIIVKDRSLKPEGCSKGYNVKKWYQAKYVPSPTETTDVEKYIPELESKPFWRSIKDWFGAVFTGPPPTCQPHFNSPYARRVNDVLSLYEDLDSPVFAPYGMKLREALERLRRSQGIVEFNEPRDRQVLVGIEQGLKPDLLEGAKGSKETKDLPALQALLRAYRNFLVPTEGEKGKLNRQVGQLMDALKTFVQEGTATQSSEKSMELALIKEWNESKSYEGDDTPLYDKRLPFRAVWKLLGEQHTRLDEATGRLCLDGPQGDKACRQLRERVKGLADAYWESGQAARDLWEENLSLLVRIERVSREEQAASGRYHALKEKVIRLAVEMTSVRQIASVLSRLRDTDTCQLLENTLTRAWKQICAGKSTEIAWTEENVKNNQEHFETMLRQVLSSASGDTALFLMALDRAEQYADPDNSVAQPLVRIANRVNPKRLVRLGLNRNFVEANGTEMDNVDQAVEAVNRMAHGFGRGRLSNGLHTLTEKYLDSHNRARSCPALDSQQRCEESEESDDQRRLLDGLVEFAQKLLFLANHDSLASPPGTDGLIIGGGENILRGLFGDDLIDGYQKTSVIGHPHAPQAMTKRYVRVLQAVGNSILFSANELRERDRYQDLSKKRVPAEVAAVNAVYSPDPRKVLNDLVKELQAEQVLAQQQLDEARAKQAAIDGQNGSLAALKTGEDNADDEVNKAMQALGDYRSKLSQLKAIHDVVTLQVVGQIKKGWTAAGAGDAVDPADFLTGQAGLDKQLDAIRLAQDGTLTPEERSLFEQAIAYAKAQESKVAFEAYRSLHGLTSRTRADLLTAFIAHLRELEAARAARVAQYEKILKEKEQARHDVQKQIAQLTAESARLAAVIVALPVTKAKLTTAETVIEAVKDEVLKASQSAAPFLSPDAVYELLISHVQHKAVAETDAGKKQSYKDTQAVLAKRTPPPALPPLKEGDYSNPLEVMDQVIALLRHRQMEAVERFGKDSEQDKKATDALENAYQHRAGMIYLRPSSAYLRTSFPSTSLQDDPNLAWDNMLLSQGIRNLPFSSQLADILNPSEKQDRALTAELDKQYWQNINRVRVSGAGFTNQALVKDDVGNWYVKHYFGDTERIVKSAKHLALYSLGTKLPIDLSHELRTASIAKDDSKKTAAEKEAELPPLQQVFGKHRTAYHAHTADTATKLAELHGQEGTKTVYAQIVAAWKRDAELAKDADLVKAFTAVLAEEVVQWDKTLEPLTKASDQERGLAITKDLYALAKFEKLLSARIRQSQKEEPLKSQAAKAADEAHRVVGPVLLDLLKDYKQGLDRYEQAVLFIGDAANPKDSKQEQGK